MLPTLMSFAAGLLLVLVAGVVWLWRRHSVRPSGPAALTVTTRGRSADGAMVRLVVDLTFSCDPVGSVPSRRHLAHEVENALRACLATRRLLALPGVGDHLELPVPVPGVRIHHMVVTGSDVEVTRELRRLVGGP